MHEKTILNGILLVQRYDDIISPANPFNESASIFSEINNKATTLVSDGSFYLGLETTFAGHKGCHPFSELPF